MKDRHLYNRWRYLVNAKMKLLIKEIEKQLPPLRSTEGIPLDEKIAIVKFFSPYSDWTWYAVEGEYDKEISDFTFFGLVFGFEREWGYFTLQELETVELPSGLRIERDKFFTPTKIKDL